MIIELAKELDDYLVNWYIVGDVLVVKWSSRLLVLDSHGRYVLCDGSEEFCGITQTVGVGCIRYDDVDYTGDVIQFDDMVISL